ncbi:MAG: NAD-dependent epimerase/dehydratase family protein [Candidatus Bathyarchaeia archaeon]
MKLEKVLVTGGAGFIGSCLVKELINSGYFVVVLDNFCSGSIENLRRFPNKGLLEVVKGDIRDKNIVERVLKGVDAVVHLAALIDVKESVRNPLETHDVNVNGTLNVLESSVRADVKKFVFASSTAVYGDTNKLPLKEYYPIRPISPYAASKAAAESYCLVFNRCYGIKTVILRFFNVYGPGQKNSVYSGVITKFLENALNDKPLIIYGDGKQTRDFIYVDDVIKATILALEKNGLEGGIFNVCSGKPTSVNELVEIIKIVMRKNLKVIHDKPREGDIKSNYGNPLKSEKMLGFKNRTNLVVGLKKILSSCIN